MGFNSGFKGLILRSAATWLLSVVATCWVLNVFFSFITYLNGARENYINCFIAKTAYLTETGNNCCHVNQNGSLTNTQAHKHTMSNMRDICCVLNFFFSLSTQNYINCFIAKTAYLTETGNNCCHVNQNGSLTNTQAHKRTMSNMRDICWTLNFLFTFSTQNYINCFIVKTVYLTETGNNCCHVNQNGSLTNTQAHKHTMPNMRDICCVLNFFFSLSTQNYINCFIAKTAYITETGNNCCHVNQNGSLTNT